MQAVAHGSQSVMTSVAAGPGGAEMFHGAVVDHYGERNAVFGTWPRWAKSWERLESVYEAQPRAEVLRAVRLGEPLGHATLHRRGRRQHALL
jgi:beta-galactosidase GanA